MRDTTTVAAMLGNLHRILYGSMLSVVSRDHLFAWMLAEEIEAWFAAVARTVVANA